MAFELFVNGLLMKGQRLHSLMSDSQFLGELRTAPYYRVHSINNVYPGMYSVENGETGANIWGELYLVEDPIWKGIEANASPHLYRGLIELDDGRTTYAILYPRDLAEGHHPDITEFGGWRAYMASTESA